MALGGVLALLVVILFGKGSRTDGFFAAYAVFAFLSSVAQGLRVSLPSLLTTRADSGSPLNRFLGSILLLSAATSLPMVWLAPLTAELLVGELGEPARSTAAMALMLLWVAGTFQLLAGLLAAALGADGLFGSSATAYVSGAAAAVLLTLVLAGPFGITSVSASLALGGFLTAGLMAARMARTGWRPGARRGTLRALRQLLAGSAGYAALQASYVVTLALAAGLGEGAITVYSYAFFAVLLLLGVTSGAASIVLAGSFSQTWDGSPDALEVLTGTVTRRGLVVALPALAVGVLLGDAVLNNLFPDAFTEADADQVVRVLLALSGFVLVSLAGVVPLLAALALGRHGGIVRAAVLTVSLHAVLSLLLVRFDRLELLAVAASVSQMTFVIATLAAVHGRHLRRPVMLLVRNCAPLVFTTLVAFGSVYAASRTVEGEWRDVLTAGLGSLVFLLLAAILTKPPNKTPLRRGRLSF